MSQRMAATAMRLWTDTSRTARWTYEHAVVFKGIEDVWYQTADKQYFDYIKNYMDTLVAPDGTIRRYEKDKYVLDDITPGRAVLMLYHVLGTEKYYKALLQLRDQLKIQPRNEAGGFWHKQRYPNQMWLDGLYMAAPFYTEYAAAFHDDAAFDDIAKQFILMEKQARDPKTGLLYHAWDASRKERWADPKTGLSKNFWARADGWYAMALVDVLDKFPADHPKRAELVAILNRLAIAIKKYQDAKTGLWYQILDKPAEKGNYLESSASSMFVYALAKGVRQGYLNASYLAVAQKGYKGILAKFIETDAKGQVSLKGTVSVGGLGGSPYRDGSFAYYMSEKVVTNDPKGVGAFIQASVEIERAAGIPAGKQKTVLLDSYFNSEKIKDVTGTVVPYHYQWNEMFNNGFSLLGHIFHNNGFKTATLFDAPTAVNLKKADVFIIVDPDIPKENPTPNYIEAAHITAIANWVKNGGVLAVFANDKGNAEFEHLNKQMATFGMQFNEGSWNHVDGAQFEMGAIYIPKGNEIFKTTKKVYLKEISILSLKAPARAALKDKNGAVVAVAKYGKGTVFAVGDPWFYNEYTDGRKLPADFENFTAANDFVKWLVKQVPVKK
jgi:unsaturated rhamnogalacturonyl hydrolase